MPRLSTIGEITEPSSCASPTMSTENTSSNDRVITKMQMAVRASQHGDVDTLRLLLNGHVSADELDDEGCGLMHWAAINNRSDVIRLLLSHDANINIVGGIMKATPLHWACCHAHLDAVVTLATNGADASIKNVNGETALHVAAHTGNTLIIAYIMVKFEHIKDLRDTLGRSALMLAAKSAFGLFPTRVFVKFDVFADFIDDETGDTALHTLMSKRNYRAAVELLCAGADATKKNKSGQTAFDLVNKKDGKHIKYHAKTQTVREKGTTWDKLTSVWFLIQFFTAIITGVLIVAVFATFYLTNFWILASVLLIGVVFLAIVAKHMRIEHLGVMPVTYIFWMGAAHLGLIIFETDGFVHWSLLLLLCLIWAISASFYWVLVLTNPGVMQRSADPFGEFLQNVEEHHIDRYCFTCWIPRTETSHHCAQCDKCVDGFDHHCPWINKCVYRQNLRFFILFCLTILMFHVFYVPVLVYIVSASVRISGIESTINEHGLLVISLIFSIFHMFGAAGITYTQLSQLSRRVTTIEVIRKSRALHSSTSSNSEKSELNPYEHRVSLKDRVRNVWNLLAFDRIGDEEEQETSMSTSEKSKY